MSTTTQVDQNALLEQAKQVAAEGAQAVSKLKSFWSSENGQILLSIVQALVLPFLLVCYYYFFKNPTGAPFLDVIPKSLYFAPLQIAKNLLPQDLMNPVQWTKEKRGSTIKKTIIGALFVGVGLMTSSMLVSVYLTGGYGLAPVVMSVVSLVGIGVAAVLAGFVTTPPEELLNGLVGGENANKTDTTTDPKDVEKGAAKTNVSETRDRFIMSLMFVLFLTSVAALLGGLVVSAVFMVVGVAAVTVMTVASGAKGVVSNEEKKKEEAKKAPDLVGTETTTTATFETVET